MSGSSTAHKLAAATKPVWHVVDAKGQVCAFNVTAVCSVDTAAKRRAVGWRRHFPLPPRTSLFFVACVCVCVCVCNALCRGRVCVYESEVTQHSHCHCHCHVYVNCVCKLCVCVCKLCVCV